MSCTHLSEAGTKEEKVWLLWGPCATHPLTTQLVGQLMGTPAGGGFGEGLQGDAREMQEITLALCFCSFCLAEQMPRCG